MSLLPAPRPSAFPWQLSFAVTLLCCMLSGQACPLVDMHVKAAIAGGSARLGEPAPGLTAASLHREGGRLPPRESRLVQLARQEVAVGVAPPLVPQEGDAALH